MLFLFGRKETVGGNTKRIDTFDHPASILPETINLFPFAEQILENVKKSDSPGDSVRPGRGSGICI